VVDKTPKDLPSASRYYNARAGETATVE